jgi:hypothetical protein
MNSVRVDGRNTGVATTLIMAMLDAGGFCGLNKGAVELKPGDWVRSESGEVGRIVHISRLTVFVDVRVAGKDNRITAFLQSQLKRIPAPDREGDDQKKR